MVLNSDELYDNAYQHDNVYGHAVGLLERYRDARLGSNYSGCVHLDLGCGFGRIAEEIRDRLGLHYIGIDGASPGPQSLELRGFESHVFLFDSFEQALAEIRRIVGGRRIASLTMLDTLEHLTNGDEVLRMIRELIGPTMAPAAISVPNVGHRDVGLKLAFGRWDYTRDGLLDHTHVRLFSQSSFHRTLQAAGLQVIDSNDVKLAISDQHFPDTHPALSRGTTLNELFTGLRTQLDSSATVNQFVRLVVAGPQSQSSAFIPDGDRYPRRPFLSIVMRTQGKRPHCMVEALTALAGQKDRDFELLVLGHRLSPDEQKSVERVLEDSPQWLRKQSRLVRVDEGNRTLPLNRGFEEAVGEYIAILDDDDVPMGHWVATFRKLARQKPGAVLRTIAVRQDVDIVEIDSQAGVRAVGGLDPYPARFDLLQHLVTNETPPIALAFPRGVFHDLNIRFDETLTTTEDWDFLLRCAVVVGVCAAEEITAVYHWWNFSVESSRTVHDQAEWDANYLAIHRKLDGLPIILPAGSARQLRLLRTLHNVKVPGIIAPDNSSYLKEVVKILSSRSWRWSSFMRWPAMLRGRRDPQIVACLDMTEPQLAKLLARLKKSSSWRRTAIFRRREDR